MCFGFNVELSNISVIWRRCKRQWYIVLVRANQSLHSTQCQTPSEKMTGPSISSIRCDPTQDPESTALDLDVLPPVLSGAGRTKWKLHQDVSLSKAAMLSCICSFHLSWHLTRLWGSVAISKHRNSVILVSGLKHFSKNWTRFCRWLRILDFLQQCCHILT